jgi:diaminohydroxyphosphoribosylaminopyrimidine deaminase/5-amino-6-(5-phosphoribosylamino)uracil reductase
MLRTHTDHEHLARTLELAQRGLGSVHPNPVVGAVVARDGQVLGEGWHAEYGGPHAEVNAIAACDGADLRGATMYVSLEPCCHQGKTPPCTDAILAAGIGRVVVASDDPTEKAAGRGLGILRDEGVDVDVADGELAAAARLLNQAFRKHARTGHPWVLFKSAMSLDGKVATAQGDSKWISSEASRELAHRWRASVDAVAVGIGTALADDPQLTARLPGVSRQPRRVVFDSTGRLPLDSRLVRAAAELPLTVVISRAAPRSAADALEMAGADVIVATGQNEPARVSSALGQLGDRGIASLLLEGGPAAGGRLPGRGRGRRGALLPRPDPRRRPRGRDPLEGEGVSASPTPCGAHPDLRALGRRRPAHRAPAGVVRMFTGLVEDLGTVAALDATPDGVRSPSTRAWPPTSARGTPSRSTASA